MTTGTNGNNIIQILLVEDNPDDAKSTEETIKRSEHSTNITVAEDGEVAMNMLHRQGEYAETPRPDLILLNFKLPKKDGSQVLSEINQDPDLSGIPLIILTATEAEQSLLTFHNIPPSRYWRKPFTLDRFNMAVNQLATLAGHPITMGEPEREAELVGAGVGEDSESRKKWWWPF